MSLNEFTKVAKTKILSPVHLERASLSSFFSLFNEMRDSDAEVMISLYVRGAGGDLDTAFSVYDILKSDVLNETILVGRGLSACTVLFAAGKQRKHYANSSIGLHPCLNGGDNGIDTRTLKRVIQDASWYDKRVLEVLTVNSRRPFLWWKERVDMGNEMIMEYLDAMEIQASGLGELVLPVGLK